MAGKNNMPLLHLYVLLGFPCLSRFYRSVLEGQIRSRIIRYVTAVFLVFTVVNSLFVQQIFRFNSYALVLESMLIILLSLYTFAFLLNNTASGIPIPDKSSISWINSGLFIYHVSCLLIFYFGDTILFCFPLALSRFTWAFHALFSIVMNSCFLVGLWKRSGMLHLSMH
ncbi:hypothetical protein GCM10023092_25590 [Rurimicrobium arvi]|uniref:Uncharacterized protein n=2 Tax=Rurimicrobium arvi TaxID=2049916 RepID=A0ABP8MXZ9_9BACT